MTADLHYFSGDSAFSLSRLDANTRHIAELERQFVQLPGGNGNMPFHCREGLAFFTPEGEEEQPEGEEDQGPTPKEGSLWAPGLVDRIAFSEVYTRPRISEGCILLPLAGERTEGETVQPMPGGVRSVQWAAGLPAPCIRKGVIQLPVADSALPAMGALRAVQPGGAWGVADGVVNIPFATSAADRKGEDGTAIKRDEVAGVMRAVSVSEEATEPELDGGELKLPLAGYDSAAGVLDCPGLIKSVEMIAGASSPSIKSGVLKIPVSGVELCDTFAPQVGLIRDIQPVDEAAWSISDGSIRVPKAQHYPAGGVASVAGVLSGVQWTTEAGISDPYIWQGVLNIPVPDVSDQMLTHCKVEQTTDDAGTVHGTTLRLRLADYESGAGSGVNQAGLVNAIAMASGGSPRIEDGCIVVPTHSFDPQQFSVSEGGLVSLQQVFPSGLYNAVNNQKITWQQFLSGNSAVPLSAPVDGMRLCAFHLNGYLSFYLEKVDS